MEASIHEILEYLINLTLKILKNPDFLAIPHKGGVA